LRGIQQRLCISAQFVSPIRIYSGLWRLSQFKRPVGADGRLERATKKIRMLIQEITQHDCLSLLAHLRLGRLACARDSQPYVTPFYFAYDRNCIYSFATVGQRIDWMRANPLVCVETGEMVSSQEWVSIVVFGRYEELPDKPEKATERALAHQLLQQKIDWWEPGYAKTVVGGTERPLEPVYYRIQIVQITGRHGVPHPGEELKKAPSNDESTGKGAMHSILEALRSRVHSK